MGFLGDLVEVAADPVKLPHKVVVGGRRRVLGNQAVHQMAQVRLAGKAAAFYFLVKGFRLFFVQPELDVYVAFSHSSESSLDRKSTRLNSSHVSISYAVFCLKKKKFKTIDHRCYTSP